MALRFTKAADTDIFDLVTEGIEKRGIIQAEAYASGLKSALETIEDVPQIMRLRDEYTPPVKIYRFSSHFIVYITDDQGVLVLRVRHGREDWSVDPMGADQA